MDGGEEVEEGRFKDLLKGEEGKRRGRGSEWGGRGSKEVEEKKDDEENEQQQRQQQHQ